MCFLPWTLLWSPYRMLVGIKTSPNIKLHHTVGLQTPTMLMNVPRSLITSRGERSFFLAIFLMKYSLRWGSGLSLVVCFFRTVKEGMKKTGADDERAVISLCDFYILKAPVCVSCRVFVFTIFGSSFADKWTENQWEKEKEICSPFMDVIMAATPGALCGLNIIHNPQTKGKNRHLFLFDPHGQQIRWVSVPSLILCTSYPYFLCNKLKVLRQKTELDNYKTLIPNLLSFSLSPSFFSSSSSPSLLIISNAAISPILPLVPCQHLNLIISRH